MKSVKNEVSFCLSVIMKFTWSKIYLQIHRPIQIKLSPVKIFCRKVDDAS